VWTYREEGPHQSVFPATYGVHYSEISSAGIYTYCCCRRKAWPPESICVSTSRDRVLGSLASCLLIQPGGSVPWCKAQESAAEPVGVVGNNADKSVAVTVFPRPAHELQHVARRGESVGEGGHEEPPAECPICLERCDGADGLIRLRCRHVFHSSCLERWLRCRRDCPYCRASVLQ
jgi:hypothetical protein